MAVPSATPILSLPDELILEITNHFHGRYRNTQLTNLALTCRRMHLIATEKLLCDPRFSLGRVHHYLWELAHHPHFMPKIRRLELWSSSEGRMPAEVSQRSIIGLQSFVRSYRYPKTPCPPELLGTQFLDQCLEIFSFFAQKTKYDRLWETKVEEDVVPTLLAVLLLALPNLEELKCAAAWLMDFPFFGQLVTRNTATIHPEGWRHKYLWCVARELQRKLHILEFPTDLSHMMFVVRSPRTLLDFRAFAHLKQLSIPMHVIPYSIRRVVAIPGPELLFPPTLELLRISEASECTANLLNDFCLAKKRKKFPCLTRVEAYFRDAKACISDEAARILCPDPVVDVRRMCTDAALAILLFFPGTVLTTSLAKRSVWDLREEGVMEEVQKEVWQKRMGSFGIPERRYEDVILEVDAAGDVVMG